MREKLTLLDPTNAELDLARESGWRLDERRDRGDNGEEDYHLSRDVPEDRQVKPIVWSSRATSGGLWDFYMNAVMKSRQLGLAGLFEADYRGIELRVLGLHNDKPKAPKLDTKGFTVGDRVTLRHSSSGKALKVTALRRSNIGNHCVAELAPGGNVFHVAHLVKANPEDHASGFKVGDDVELEGGHGNVRKGTIASFRWGQASTDDTRCVAIVKWVGAAPNVSPYADQLRPARPEPEYKVGDEVEVKPIDRDGWTRGRVICVAWSDTKEAHGYDVKLWQCSGVVVYLPERIRPAKRPHKYAVGDTVVYAGSLATVEGLYDNREAGPRYHVRTGTQRSLTVVAERRLSDPVVAYRVSGPAWTPTLHKDAHNAYARKGRLGHESVKVEKVYMPCGLHALLEVPE